MRAKLLTNDPHAIKSSSFILISSKWIRFSVRRLTLPGQQLLVLFVVSYSCRYYFSLLAWRNLVNTEVPVLQTMMMIHTNAFVERALLGKIVKQVSQPWVYYFIFTRQVFIWHVLTRFSQGRRWWRGRFKISLIIEKSRLINMHERGTKKLFESPTGIEPMTSRNTGEALYPLSHEDSRRARPVHVWQASCILLGSVLSK